MPPEQVCGTLLRMEWVKIYDLANDQQYVTLAQRATLEAPGGLAPEPALLGSSEWWNAVERGELESHWVVGTIRRPMWASMNDFPVVEVEESDGVSSWERFGDVTQYSKGRGIRIRWVWQRRKEPIEGLGDMTKVVIEIWLEAGNWRPTAGFGPGPGRSLDEGWEGGLAD
jgi:hypothetical protein